MPLLKATHFEGKQVLAIEFSCKKHREAFYNEISLLPVPPGLYKSALITQIRRSKTCDKTLYILDVQSSPMIERGDRSAFRLGTYKTDGSHCDQLNINFGYTIAAEKVAGLLGLHVGYNHDCMNDSGVLRFYQSKLNYSGTKYLVRPDIINHSSAYYMSEPANRVNAKIIEVKESRVLESINAKFSSTSAKGLLSSSQKLDLHSLIGDDLMRVESIQEKEVINTDDNLLMNSLSLCVSEEKMSSFHSICKKVRKVPGLFREFGRDRNKKLYVNINPEAIKR